MKKLILSLVFFTLINHIEGALSPFYQSIQEIKHILDNQYLALHFSQAHPLINIQLDEEAEGYRIYKLTSEDSFIFAKINYIEASKLGPRQYEISWSHSAK